MHVLDVLFGLLKASIISSCEVNCTAESVNESGIVVHWPESAAGQTVFSTPYCLDDHKSVKSRTCCEEEISVVNGKPCDFYAETLTNQCPPGYDELRVQNNKKIFCVLLTRPQKWDETCLQSGSTINFLELSLDYKNVLHSYLRNRSVEQFWIPAKRDLHFDPIVWKTPGRNWGRPINFGDYDVEFNESQFNGSCLKIDISKNFVQANVEDCSIKHPLLCIYNENSTMRLSCPPNHYTTRYSAYQNKCFHINNESLYHDLSDLFNANSVRDISLFESLANHYDLSDSAKCLVNINLEPSIKYKTINRRGKWMLSDTFNCVGLQMDNLNFEEPQIYLKFDKGHQFLSLVIYSQNYLWRKDQFDPGVQCYTNANNEILKPVKIKQKMLSESRFVNTFSSINFNKSVYELKLDGDGPGYYWCEGHAVPDFKLIKSSKIVAYKKNQGAIFAALVEIINNKFSSIYQAKYLKEISKNYLDNIKLLKNNEGKRMGRIISLITNVRVMKIDSVNEKESKVKLVFHISMSKDDDDISSVDSMSSTDSGDNSEEEVVDELGVSEDVLKYYKLKLYLFEVLTAASSPNFRFISMNSTEFCLPVTLTTETNYNWLRAKIGETIVPKELCMVNNDLPMYRKCIGDYIYGGTWEVLNPSLKCLDLKYISDTTKQLYEFGLSPEITSENTTNVLENISQLTSNFSSLIPADLFYVSKIIQTIQSTVTDTNDSVIYNQNDYYNLATILNNLMYVNDTIVKISQVSLNTTNILLDSFDNLINQLTLSSSSSSSTTSSNHHNHNSTINLVDENKFINEANGTITLHTPRLIVFMADPLINNISGMALIRKDTNENDTEEDFSHFEIRHLTSKQSVNDLILQGDLELASFVPELLLNEIRFSAYDQNATEVINPVKVVISIYYNDKIFKENKNVTFSKSTGKIISVTIPGYGPNLPGILPIVFKSNRVYNETANLCGYWDFSPADTTSTGEWASDGCKYMDSNFEYNDLVVCGCSHLTHFAYLVLGRYEHQMMFDDVIVKELNFHSEALDIITLLGCSLSLIGIFGIFITAIMFQSWREKASSKILLQLSAAIALQMILMCFVNTEGYALTLVKSSMFNNCVILGAILHYSVLVAFTWMLITAFLQFMRYVKVLGSIRPSRFILKSFCVGWGLPILPVIATALIAPESYIPPIEPTINGICYPTGHALYFGLLLPIFLIISANLVIFILVIYNVFKGHNGKLRTNERDLTLQQLRLSIFLFFLLGLSWIFGLAAATKAGLIFSYLFCLTATIQGFVLFVYFIIMDPMTRNLWVNNLRTWGCNSNEKEAALHQVKFDAQN